MPYATTTYVIRFMTIANKLGTKEVSVGLYDGYTLTRMEWN